MPTDIRIIGFKHCHDTRKAQRFFAERRVKVHFVDLSQGSLKPGELKLFAQRLGIPAIVDRAGQEFARSGLAFQSISEENWLKELANRPKLLVTPLCRCGQDVTVGPATETWQEWVDRG